MEEDPWVGVPWPAGVEDPLVVAMEPWLTGEEDPSAGVMDPCSARVRGSLVGAVGP